MTLLLTPLHPSTPLGVATHLLLNATGLESPGRITGVELVDLGADTLMQIPVRPAPDNPDLYNLTAFMPPSDFFYIKVRGYFFRLRGYFMKVHGYFMKVRGYFMKVRGYFMKVRGYFFRLRGYFFMKVRCYFFRVRGY
jgi:hypothetical protein